MIYPAKFSETSHDRVREGKEIGITIDKIQLLELICTAAEDDSAYT